MSAILKNEVAHNRAADLRAGLVAATIANVHRKKGRRAFTPEDFISGPPQYMAGEQARRAMRAWASDINRGLKARREDNA